MFETARCGVGGLLTLLGDISAAQSSAKRFFGSKNVEQKRRDPTVKIDGGCGGTEQFETLYAVGIVDVRTHCARLPWFRQRRGADHTISNGQ
jgi:hypothetical protein